MRIPMTDKVRALNVSNSAAIVIYEALRQQDYNDLLREEPGDERHKGADFLERD
jgi:tRNA (cytidine/uridine-2'-O-)-methyltransferase